MNWSCVKTFQKVLPLYSSLSRNLSVSSGFCQVRGEGEAERDEDGGDGGEGEGGEGGEGGVK